MEGCPQILILDCHGEARPAICFSLEISGYMVRVVTRADEAINMLETAKLTGHGFNAFLINNPCSDQNIEAFLMEVLRSGSGVPIVFVSQFAEREKMLAGLEAEQSDGLYFSDPLMVKSLLAELINEQNNSQRPLEAGRYS